MVFFWMMKSTVCTKSVLQNHNNSVILHKNDSGMFVFFLRLKLNKKLNLRIKVRVSNTVLIQSSKQRFRGQKKSLGDAHFTRITFTQSHTLVACF